MPAYQPPSTQLAEQHRREANPQYALERPWRAVPSDLNKYGVGVVLYFSFLRTLVAAFAALTLLAVPLVVANLSGDALGGAPPRPTRSVRVCVWRNSASCAPAVAPPAPPHPRRLHLHRNTR